MPSYRQVKLDDEDVNWYNSTYPGGSLTWVLGLMLKEFRKAHSLTPADYAAIGAKELRKQLEEKQDGR